jgi:RNA polymerase sigma-70 factor, ECF subfamily
MHDQVSEESNGPLHAVGLASSISGVVTNQITFAIEHMDGLYGYAVALTRNRLQAEDLVQETYVRALEAAPRLREDSNIKGWMFAILRNLWLNELRKRKSSPCLIDIDFDSVTGLGQDPHAQDSHKILASKEDAETVRVALSKLPAHFREILLLREFEELSYREIAEILGCPQGTVMSRLGRARTKLRSLLEPGWSSRRYAGAAGAY